MLAGNVKIIKTQPDLPTPAYYSDGAAGLDLAANDNYAIAPGEIRVIRTGIKMEIPEGCEGTIRGRSGLAFKHHVFATHIGTIDADYRGELLVMLINRGTDIYWISKGDRVGQIVISPIVKVSVEEVDLLSKSKRSANGFGNTGK